MIENPAPYLRHHPHRSRNHLLSRHLLALIRFPLRLRSRHCLLLWLPSASSLHLPLPLHMNLVKMKAMAAVVTVTAIQHQEGQAMVMEIVPLFPIAVKHSHASEKKVVSGPVELRRRSSGAEDYWRTYVPPLTPQINSTRTRFVR
jgi:hypothetical protein